MTNTRSGRIYQPPSMSTNPQPSAADLQALIATLQTQVAALQNASATAAASGADTSTIKFRANPFAADINPATSNGLKLSSIHCCDNECERAEPILRGPD